MKTNEELVWIKVKKEGQRAGNKRRSYWWFVSELTWNPITDIFYGYKLSKKTRVEISLSDVHEIQKIEGPDVFGGQEFKLIKVPNKKVGK